MSFKSEQDEMSFKSEQVVGERKFWEHYVAPVTPRQFVRESFESLVVAAMTADRRVER